MKNSLSLSTILLITLFTIGSAQTIDSTGLWKMLPDSIADTASRQAKTDTLHAAAVSVSDSASNQPAASSLKLIKRNYNSRQQLLLASGMMVFVIAMMTLAQQFNPD
jgi:hypothetical protein